MSPGALSIGQVGSERLDAGDDTGDGLVDRLAAKHRKLHLLEEDRLRPRRFRERRKCPACVG